VVINSVILCHQIIGKSTLFVVASWGHWGSVDLSNHQKRNTGFASFALMYGLIWSDGCDWPRSYVHIPRPPCLGEQPRMGSNIQIVHMDIRVGPLAQRADFSSERRESFGKNKWKVSGETGGKYIVWIILLGFLDWQRQRSRSSIRHSCWHCPCRSHVTHVPRYQVFCTTPKAPGGVG
jgi:hypothetical protein